MIQALSQRVVAICISFFWFDFFFFVNFLVVVAFIFVILSQMCLIIAWYLFRLWLKLCHVRLNLYPICWPSVAPTPKNTHTYTQIHGQLPRSKHRNTEKIMPTDLAADICYALGLLSRWTSIYVYRKFICKYSMHVVRIAFHSHSHRHGVPLIGPSGSPSWSHLNVLINLVKC